MRDFKGMKRQRGRNRGGGGKPSGGGGGGGNNANRAFDSNGPDGVKIRGHAQHIYEKYQQLSRDAASSGDRVLLENYLQHAEHYYRLIRTLQPQRLPSEIMGRDSVTNGYDIDFEDESGEPLEGAPEPDPPAEGSAEGQDRNGEFRRDDREVRRDRERDSPRDRDFNRGEGQRDFNRGEGQREFRDREPGRGEPRPEARGDRPERPFGENRGERDARPEVRSEARPEGKGERRRDRDRDFERRPERDEPRAEGREVRGEPRQYGRDERREREAGSSGDVASAADISEISGGDDGQMLRDRNGGFSPAPAFLQAAPLPTPLAEPEEERRPRRRRRTRDEIDRDNAAASEAAGESRPPVETEEA